MVTCINEWAIAKLMQIESHSAALSLDTIAHDAARLQECVCDSVLRHYSHLEYFRSVIPKLVV